MVINSACSGIAGGKQGILHRLCYRQTIQKGKSATSWERTPEHKTRDGTTCSNPSQVKEHHHN